MTSPHPSPAVFDAALRGRLVGISDRLLAQHLDLYGRYIAEAEAIDRESRRLSWTRPTAAAPGLDVVRLYETPIASLALEFGGVIQAELEQLRSDLNERDISFFPAFYLGDVDFWTTDEATSINVPWFLANAQLWELVNERTSRFSVEEIRKILRHETGHALNYAFKLYDTNSWRQRFGDFAAPYRDLFVGDPSSRDYVRYLDRTGMKHYAQKHPDEDFAETFATWLDGDWRERYAGWPGAMAKLQYVDQLAQAGALAGDPPVTDLGLDSRIPYQSLPGTIGDYVGQDETGWSPQSALLRRAPEVLNACALHASYFEALGGSAAGPTLGRHATLAAAVEAFGSWDAYLRDLRAIAGSTSGWAVTVWDPRSRHIRNALVDGHSTGLPAGCPLLLAMDCWDHAWAADYGGQKHMGIAAFFRNVDWGVVDQRLETWLGVREAQQSQRLSAP